MLPRKNRLILTKEKYARAVSKGGVFHTKNLRLVKNKAKKESPPKFAILVPKRLDKRAVKRNRTKRLIAGAAYELLPKIKKGREAIIAAKTLLNGKLQDVRPEVESAFKKASLLI